MLIRNNLLLLNLFTYYPMAVNPRSSDVYNHLGQVRDQFRTNQVDVASEAASVSTELNAFLNGPAIGDVLTAISEDGRTEWRTPAPPSDLPDVPNDPCAYVIARETFAGPLSWKPVCVLSAPFTVSVNEGLPRIFDPLQNSRGIGVQATHANGTPLVVGVPLVLPSGSLLVLSPDGLMHFLGCSVMSESVTLTLTDMMDFTANQVVTFEIAPLPLDNGTPYYSSSGQLSRFVWNPQTNVIDQVLVGPVNPNGTYNAWGVVGHITPPTAAGNNFGGGFGGTDTLTTVDLTTGSSTNFPLVTAPGFSSINRGDYNWRLKRSYVISPVNPGQVYGVDWSSGSPVMGPVGINIGGAVRNVADVMYMPNLDAFFDVDGGTGDVSLGVVNPATNDITWTSGGPLTGYFSPVPFPNGYGGGFADLFGNVWTFSGSSGPTNTQLYAMRITGSVGAPVVTTGRKTADVSTLGGFNDAGSNSQFPTLFTYPWGILDANDPFALCFQHVIQKSAPYTTPTNIATINSRVSVFTAPDVITKMEVKLLDALAGDSLALTGNVQPGQTYNIQTVGASIVLLVTGNQTGANYNTVLQQITFQTTSVYQAPRNIEVTLYQIDNVASLRPMRAVIYLI